MTNAPLTIDTPARPILHLSGARLRAILASLIAASEPVGGIERFAAAVRLKGEIIRSRFADSGRIELSDVLEVARLMPTVRRRIGGLIEQSGWATVRAAIADLLAGANIPGTADRRTAQFDARLAGGQGARRFVRDLAAEILHGVHPEIYPLMTRWVWDARTNTGVLREIWHDPVAGEATDSIIIDVSDAYETFLVLREELSRFLSDEGVFRDVPWYVDLLKAHVYAGYINAQGGAFLKAEFASEGDPLEHTRRILGLDATQREVVKSGSRKLAGGREPP